MTRGPTATGGARRGDRPGIGRIRRVTAVAMAAVGIALSAGCGPEEPWDGVVMVKYGTRALEGHVKRRMGLLTAGVPLRNELAADTVWTDVLGHTFIGRCPDLESGIRSLGARCLGISLRRRGVGIDRAGPDLYRLQDGYFIADVFAPTDRYLGSAVVAAGMSGRQILRHVGVTRGHSETVDRLYLDGEEVAAWRELLPVVIQNRGYGYLYTRPERGVLSQDEQARGDSVKVMAQRFEIEQVEGYALVGKDRGAQSYRHVFTPGGEYRVTAIQYGLSRMAGRELLSHLGLVAADASSP